MYTQYILKYFQEGGAKIEPMNVLDIPDTSVKIFISPESLINPMGKMDHIPPINRENLKKDMELDTGAQSIKKCTLMLSNEEGNNLIQFINSSVKALKDKLRTGIQDLENHQKEVYDMYRKSVILDDKTSKKMDVYSYFKTIENKLKLAKSAIEDIDKEYMKNIQKLVDGYNQDKKGRHPPIMSNSIFLKAKQEIMNKLKPKTKYITPDTESKSEIGVKGKLILEKEELECDIVSVHLSKGLISVTYNKMIKEKQKHFDKDVSFKNLCIGTEISQTSEEEEPQAGGIFENEQFYSATSEDM